MTRTIAPLVMAVLTACARAAPAPQPQPEPAAESLPNDVHWVRNSAEYRAITIQTYRAASDRIRAMADTLPRGGWAVILDADETVLDNSEYQRRLTVGGRPFRPFTDESWNAWVREIAAGEVPGAGAFIALVRSLGGRVAIVTNRDQVVCPETRQNLQRLDIAVDVVLCRSPETGDKDPRFEAVRAGTASPELPSLRVVAWVGDNIHDFPGMSQELRTADASAFANFGRTWFVIPNPMYGSFQRNPPR